MAARTKPAQEFIPADPEREAQAAYGRALLAAPETPEEPDPDDVALQAVLSELGSSGTDAKVNIYQLDARQNRAFVGAFLPSEFSLERVQSEYGPGDYEIRVYNAGRLATRKAVKIAAPKNSTAVTISTQSGIDAGKIIETMNQGFQQIGQMFAQALGSLAQNQPKPKTTLETLQEFQLMKEVFGQPAPAQTNDPMQMISMAMELSDKIRPREGEPSAGEIMMEALKNFAPAINQMVTAPKPVMLPAQVIAHNPVPVQSPVPAQSPAVQTSENDMDLMTKIYVKTILAAAQNEADPETYANNILDLLPEETVLAFVNKPEWFAEVTKAVPEAAPFATWFTALKTCILDLTSLEDTSSVEAQAKTVAPINAD